MECKHPREAFNLVDSWKDQMPLIWASLESLPEGRWVLVGSDDAEYSGVTHDECFFDFGGTVVKEERLNALSTEPLCDTVPFTVRRGDLDGKPILSCVENGGGGGDYRFWILKTD